MQIAQWLMDNRDRYDPDPQRKILRKATLAYTDDPALSLDLVPETPVVSSSIHDAELASAPLLLGLPTQFKQGVNHQEYAAELLQIAQAQVQKAGAKGGMSPDELMGVQNLLGMTVQGQPVPGNGVNSHLQQLAQDETQKPLVKQLHDQMTQVLNMVKKFAQQQAQAAKAQQQGGNGKGGLDPKDQAKIAATAATAQNKIQMGKASHAQKTAQRQISFEQKMAQDKQRHEADIAKLDLEGAADIQRNRLRGLLE
jgi:hypothetical protein